MTSSAPDTAHFRQLVAGFKDFKGAFELVKQAVQQKFGMQRTGLNLALQVMPSHVGAYHALGSNAIVVNSYVLSAIKEITGGGEKYNSYVFMVLAHEYLHSLGIVDEQKVRQMTYEMCRSMLGEDHWSTRMAREDPASIFPQLRLLDPSKFGMELSVVKDFDLANQSYIQ